MRENGNQSSNGVLTKAYEISYAAFRIASRTGSVALREHLERQALSLLDAATVENYGWINIVSRAIGYLIRFGGDVGLVNEENKETILRELAELDARVAGTEKPAVIEPVPLDDIFSGQEPLFRNELIRKARPAIRQTERKEDRDSEQLRERERESADPSIRQETIFNIIRQSGNCRLRDLTAALPDYSERTLRYDLETLSLQGLVERIGNGGPAVFYRIRQTAANSPADIAAEGSISEGAVPRGSV